MAVFFTADTHFGHKGILHHRPFETVEEMNDEIIKRWNEIVGHGDEVYVLGDFSFGGKPFARSILSRLHGRKYLAKGTHDGAAAKLVEPFQGADTYPADERFERVEDVYLVTLDRKGLPPVRLFLAHHCHKVWPESHYGVWHLFGHSHGGLDEYATQEGKLLDVGVDTHNFYPYSLEEVIEIMKDRPPNFNDLKALLTPIDH